MKAMLEFDLDEEGEEYRAAVDGHTLFVTLKEFDSALRDAVKYGYMFDGAPAMEAQQREAEAWRGVLRQLLENNGISWVLG